MSSSSLRKNKVILADYSYRQDIENRLLMAHLSGFEVNILQEILHHSLSISIEQLAEELEIAVEALIPVLDQLIPIKLFKRQQLTLIVDKEMRKYFEFQIEKFDETFEPDFNFLQSLLNKVPIHVLPIWYAIPRTSDNIFDSIIEKYLLTPKIYRQYLDELEFDDSILSAIVRDLYETPHFKITSSELITKYHLTRECFEEYLLLLEYHFVCCLSYNKINDCWQEVVRPFAEWLEYLEFEKSTKFQLLQGSIKNYSFPETDRSSFADLWNIRNIHLVEKSLRGLNANEWVEFDQFFQGFTAPLGNKEPITLKNKGKKWKYVLPTYTDKEKQFVKAVILEKLGELGIVSTGLHQGKPCFCLTPFGYHCIH